MSLRPRKESPEQLAELIWQEYQRKKGREPVVIMHLFGDDEADAGLQWRRGAEMHCMAYACTHENARRLGKHLQNLVKG
jgi:hypothetical protein